MVRFAPWNPNMNMSEEEYKADNTAKSQAWSRGDKNWKDAGVWTGGSRDFDERTGTYRPGHRGFGNDVITRPTRDLSRRERNKQRRMELLGGGRRREKEYPSFAPTSGRNLASREDRMRMLTGESDFGGRGSRYGGREEYDRQDREFNRQFDEAPRGPQPWDSPNKPRGWGDVMDRVKPDRDKEIYRGKPPIDRNTPGYRGDGWNFGRVDYTKPSDNKVYAGGGSPIEGVSGHDFVNEPQYQNYDDTSIRKRLAALEGRPQTGGWQEDRIAALENRPQSTGGGGWQEDRIKALENRPQSTGSNWDENRIAALESRGPIVNQPTVDLSGVEGRISQLEGKGSDWQEDRIKSLEGRKPQDLSGIQGRLSELEGKAPSWQEDRISQLEGSRTQSKSARDLLDQRLASLENYYKNDPPPPPEESTGNRYEDKQAALNKMWEQTGNVYDPEAFAKNNPWGYTQEDSPDWLTHGGRDDRKGDYVRYKDQYGTGWQAEQSWAKTLPETYRKQMRDLDKEYNKPAHSAIIKGREYTAYGPAAAARLKMLDERNIHEDEYLGHGTWQNKFGEEITGQGRSGSQKRYFTSHSGLDPESEEYAKRFRRQSVYETDDGKETNLYQKSKAGTLGDHQYYWDVTGGYKPEEHGKYGWGVVGTNKSKTGQTKWDEAYYPELG